MRLFTGLDLPDEVVANLDELVRRLKPAGPIAWSPPSNLHITTKFIGEWKEERLGDLTTALAGDHKDAKAPAAPAGSAGQNCHLRSSAAS